MEAVASLLYLAHVFLLLYFLHQIIDIKAVNQTIKKPYKLRKCIILFSPRTSYKIVVTVSNEIQQIDNYSREVS